MSKQIPLTRGQFATVDDGDLEWLSKYKWSASKKGDSFYAVRTHKRKTIPMHREIICAKEGEQVDHRNGNTLQNTRSNLRIATKSQNMMNRGVQKNNKSGYKGVMWSGQNQVWVAKISVNGKNIHIGSFRERDEAARAWNEVAVRVHGDFCRLNDVSPVFRKSPANRGKRDNTSGFRGVSAKKRRWRAQLNFGRSKYLLGTFPTPEAAARAYDAKARELLGDKAKLNFPDDACPGLVSEPRPVVS